MRQLVANKDMATEAEEFMVLGALTKKKTNEDTKG
jgi:hypothetical protein